MTDTIINFLVRFPVFMWTFTIIATVTAVATVLDKPITWLVKVTPWDWDDDLVADVKANTIAKVVFKFGKQIARFSLWKNK